MLSMETSWKQVFAPDSGALLDIRVYGTTAEDYDTLLRLLTEQYGALYLEDGNPRDLPEYRTIIHRRDLVSVVMAVKIQGVEVKCFFWEEDEINLDLLPDDVDSAEKAEGIFEFMRTIAWTLNKRVLLTGENASATRQWLEAHAICAFDPPQ